MLKKTVKYTDYNGVEKTEDFFFNLNQAEIMEMELSKDGGLAEAIQRIVDAKDVPAIIAVFKELVLKAYGEKSADGKYFRKKDADGRPLYRNFEETEAYSIIFMELATDADEAAKFVKGIIPANAEKQS